MATVLVIGAGVCGLGTALLLARDGHDVTLLERDENPIPGTPDEAWDGWARKGIAQFRQPHNLMPGLRLILEAELPDVQEALRRAGATRFDLLDPWPPSLTDRTPRTIDEQLWTYTARRPLAEWVFTDAAQREPRVTMRRGVRATALLTGPPVIAGVPHVVGVRTASGEELRADVVIDAMGRASRTPEWLTAIGARPPYEECADSGFTYYTRYFRGAARERRAAPLTSIGTISVLTLPGDNGTWSVTIFTAAGDEPLRRLRREGLWTKVIRACPLHAHWVDGEPIGDVLTMSGVVDRYRRFVSDGTPVVTGLLAIADAWACTNPSAGRGLTVGFRHAVRLRDVLRDEMSNPRGLAERFDEVTETELAPWYHAQIALDRTRFAQMEALRVGDTPPAPADELSRLCISLLSTMALDPDLFRAALEYIGTITPIQEICGRPEVSERMAAARDAASTSGPPAMPGPDRERLLELVN